MSDRGGGPPFIVGRERETAEMRRLLREAAAGRPQVVALGGEAGIGKTVLAEATADHAAEAGFEVISCSLREREAARPYELWVTMIAAALGESRRRPIRELADRSLGPDLMSELFGSRWRAVGALMPDLVAESPEHSTEPRRAALPPRSRQDLFDAFVAFLRYLAGGRTTLLVVDNLHLADEESLNAFEIAVSEIETGRIMIVVTYRSTVPTSIDGPLADTLGAVSHNGNVVPIHLDRLDRLGVRTMIEHSGISADVRSVDLIFDHSEGNPLLVEELIELSRINEGALDDRTLSESALGLRARATVAARAAKLASRERSVLVVAATVGRDFTVPQIARFVPTLTAEEVNACVRAAVRVGIVRQAPGNSPRYAFAHAMIREAVLKLASRSQRARIATRVGRRLEEFYGPNASNHAHELYPLFLSADALDDRRKGIRYALAAGNRALEQFAWKGALALFGMLRSQFDDIMTPSDRAEAAVGMGSAYCASVDRVKAAECFRPAFDYYLSVRDYDRLVDIALQPIDLDLGDSYQFPLIERAVRAVPDDHPGRPALLRVYANGLYEARGCYEEARSLVHENLERARERGDRLSESHLLLDKAYLDIRSSRLAEAVESATEVLARSAFEPDSFAECHASFLLMQAHLLAGDLETSKRYAYRSRDSVVPLGDSMLTCTGIAHVLRFELRAGNWKEIEAETDRGFSIHPDDLFLLAIRAITEFYLGRFPAGDAYLERLIEMSEDYPEPRTLIFATIAQLCAHRWEISGDHKYLNRGRSQVDRMAALDLVPGVEVRMRIAQAILACQARDEIEARAVHERLSTMPTYNLIRPYRIERALGRISHLCGDHRRAAGHFLEAIASCKRFEDFPVLAWTYADYGDLLADPGSFGSHADAEGAYGQAMVLALRLRMAPLVERIESAVNRMSDRDPREAGATRGKPLTERELEVLGLIAEGKTDADVAGVLGLSTYTVSNHVRHILAKIGAFNRMEAVRYAERTGLL